MKLHRVIPRSIGGSFAAGSVFSFLLAACGGDGGNQSSSMTGGFGDTALVVNKAGVIATTATIDAHLSNPWSFVTAPGMPFWIADNNSNVATLYSGTGQIQTVDATGSNSAAIVIPASSAGLPANPTGQVYNGKGGFLIPTGKGAEAAMFIFSGEGGTLAAWAKDSGAAAVTVYDDGAENGNDHAVYKGLALGTVSGADYLYATDLHNNKVDVFDTTFVKPAAMQGKFIDPTMPAGFVPFGIAAVKDQLYVTFAKQDPAKHDEITGAGLGYVDVFDFSGDFVSRLASGGALNAPWGIALAPAGFGSFEGDLLIGNFGDGTINIFAPNGTSPATDMGPLTVNGADPFAVPGLWALSFGDGDPDKPLTTLFYTAGFANQTDGVFGSIAVRNSAVPNPY